MKKRFVIVLSVVFVNTVMVSCKASHTRCAAYGKINKIDIGKSFSDKTAKSL